MGFPFVGNLCVSASICIFLCCLFRSFSGFFVLPHSGVLVFWLLSLYFLLFWYFLDACLFCNKRQKWCGSEWEGKWRGTGRSRGRGICNHNMLSEKKIYFQWEKIILTTKIKNNLKRKETKTRRDDSAIKGTGCIFRGPEFNSQRAHVFNRSSRSSTFTQIYRQTPMHMKLKKKIKVAVWRSMTGPRTLGAEAGGWIWGYTGLHRKSRPARPHRRNQFQKNKFMWCLYMFLWKIGKLNTIIPVL